jgi:hypothetical protein
MVRFALGTTAPVASVTVPSNLALTACDQPGTAVGSQQKQKSKSAENAAIQAMTKHGR